jgi:hypothetical protein
MFDISSSQLFKSLVVGLTFEGELLSDCFMFLGSELYYWGCFWFKVPIPCASMVKVL